MVELQPAVFLQAIRTSSLHVGLLSTQWPRVGSDPKLLMWKSLGPVLCSLCPLKVMVSFCLFQNLCHKGNEEVNGVYAPTEVLCSAFVGICVSMQIQLMVTLSTWHQILGSYDRGKCNHELCLHGYTDAYKGRAQDLSRCINPIPHSLCGKGSRTGRKKP